MSLPITALGTATGPFWQHRIERSGVFSPWVNWSDTSAFTTDPDGGAWRYNTPYWLYARNPTLPPFSQGSLENEIASTFYITSDGEVRYEAVPAVSDPAVTGADYSFKPGNGEDATGWQYRLERADNSTAWRNWTSNLAFSQDPLGGNLMVDTLYWIYGRNQSLPAGTPGATDSELAAAVRIRADGSVESIDPASLPPNISGGSIQKTLLQLAKESNVALEMPDVLDEMAIDLEEVASRTEFEEADYSDLLATYEINPDKPGKVRIRGLHGNNIWRVLDAYFFGDAVTNLQRKVRYKLSELTETLTTANLSLIEGGNFLKYLSSAIVQGGFYLFQPNANGIGYRVKGLFGQFDGGAVGFSDDSGKSVQLQNGTLNTDVIDFHADLSNITIRTSTRVVLPRAQKPPTQFLVPEFADYNGNYTDRFASTSQMADAIYPDMLPLLLPHLNGGAGASRQTHLEGCVQMMPPPDTTPPKFIIGPDMVGVEQPHNLQTADLFPILLDKNKQPDTTMVLGFSDTVWVITYPPGVTSGYEGGYLRLEPL